MEDKMKKLNLTAICSALIITLFIFIVPAFGSDDLYIDEAGNVGIGTTNPSANLHIYNSSGTALQYIDSGSTSHWSSMQLRLNGSSSDQASFSKLQSDHSSFPDALYLSNVVSGSTVGFFQIDQSGDFIFGGGNIGIGTTTPDNKLDVKGTIRAEEIKVETDWSDFVFEDDYALPSLERVESYIEENKHLPDIPSAEEVKENGLPLAEIVTKQMQKIEELTLYLIEQNKQITEQNKQIIDQNNKIDEMKKEIAQLMKNN